MTCPTCNKTRAVVSGLDLFCSMECRKAWYDKGKCSRCDKKYDGKEGWDIPTYESYSDTTTLCPDCIEALNNANKRIKEINKEIENLSNSITNNTSGIYVVNEDYYIQTFDSDISFNEFKKAIEDYELRKVEIQSSKENNRNIYAQIIELEKERGHLNNILFS